MAIAGEYGISSNRQNLKDAPNGTKSVDLPAEILIGNRVRELRNLRGLSLRKLAERSGLNINTLSLVENGKTSPSVSTLQQLARALEVHIAAFFASEPVSQRVVFTLHDHRPDAAFNNTHMENLGRDLAGNAVQPFVVTLAPSGGSGDRMIVHTGHEFVYCLNGRVLYMIDEKAYLLETGDSLVFEFPPAPPLAKHLRLPVADHPGFLSSGPAGCASGPPFSNRIIEKKEKQMKIAVITEDGKTISRHFGRAPYYLVLTIEEGKIISQEMRPKLGHRQFSSEEHAEHHGQAHGQDAASHNRHVQMANAIEDCQTLLCGGMGWGAYESMRQLNIQPVVTDYQEIESAVQDFLAGKLTDHLEMLH